MDDAPGSRYLDRMRTDLVPTLLIVGVTASLIGCGSGPISSGDDELGDESSTGEETGETDTDDTDDTSDTDETGDTGEMDEACVTAEGTLGPAAVQLDGTSDRAWVIADGSEHELALVGPADDAVWLEGAGAGERIAIARSTGDFGHATIHAFDRSSGALAWTRELAGVGVSQLWVADDGWIAGPINPSQPGQLVGFAMNDDQAIVLADHQPLAAPSDGVVVAQEVLPDSSGGMIGWITLADQSWTPTQPPPSHNYGARIDDDDRTLEYMAAGPVFVRASPDASATFELPSEQLPSDDITVVGAAGRFRLLQAADPVDFNSVSVRLDIESGEAIVVDPPPPPGWSWFDCYARNARIDADGALLFELRDSASAQVWAFQPDDAQWSEVGFAVGLADDIDFAGQFGGVHVVRSAAQFMTFCPPTMWDEPPAEALVGDSLQIVRRSPALALALPSDGWSPVVVDEGERCVAYPSVDGWRVRALEGEAELSFEPSGTWQWLD